MTSMKPEILTLVGYMFSFLLYLLVTVTWTSMTVVLVNITYHGQNSEFIWSHMFDK